MLYCKHTLKWVHSLTTGRKLVDHRNINIYKSFFYIWKEKAFVGWAEGLSMWVASMKNPLPHAVGCHPILQPVLSPSPGVAVLITLARTARPSWSLSCSIEVRTAGRQLHPLNSQVLESLIKPTLNGWALSSWRTEFGLSFKMGWSSLALAERSFYRGAAHILNSAAQLINAFPHKRGSI